MPRLSRHNARIATPAEIRAMPAKIIRRIAFGGVRGLLNLGARVPVGMVGEDRDNYGGKHGLATIAEHERRLGRRAPTYFVTARPFGSGSGIYLYRVPEGWAGVGALKTDDGSPGDVETIQPHLRYIAAPGSAHHTGATYRLYHEASGASPLGFALPALDDPDLASYPDNWAEALYRRPRRRGTCPDIEDITAVATEWAFDEHPHMGAASGLSTTHSACLQGISKISSGASARPRCSLQPQPIAALSNASSPNRQRARRCRECTPDKARTQSGCRHSATKKTLVRWSCCSFRQRRCVSSVWTAAKICRLCLWR